MAKASYSKPTSQVDLEERQKKDYVPSSVLTQGTDVPLSDNGYVGVDPIYHNAANDTEKPMQAEEGPEAKIFDNFLDDDVEYPELDVDGGDDDADETGDNASAVGGGSTTPPTGSGSGSNS